MRSTFLGNTPSESALDGITQIISGDGRVDFAVSYLQVSGWHAVRHLIRGLDPKCVRILFTDQFDLTHPNALRLALNAGVQVRRYTGFRVYHPKVYLARNRLGVARGAVVGSANLSDSGLQGGVEAAILVTNIGVLRRISRWFTELWNDREGAEEIDHAFVREYQKRWRVAARGRIRQRRLRRPLTPRTRGQADHVEDIEVLDDVCETIGIPIGILSMDQAGNNIRNLSRLLAILHEFPNIEGKPLSELRLLGLIYGSTLNAIGRKAQSCESVESLAHVWCKWVKHQSDESLSLINTKIASFRRAAMLFSRLRSEVRAFFFANMHNPVERNVLMAIELLCSASEAVCELKLEDFRALAPILRNPAKLPRHLREAIQDYRCNKGSRSWTGNDRELLLRAWHKAR